MQEERSERPITRFSLQTASPTGEIASLAQYNIDQVMDIAEKITDLRSEPRCFESVLRELFVGYGLQMNFEQYVFVGSTVRSYLSWLFLSKRDIKI